MTDCPLPLPRRIVVSNLPLPATLSSIPNAEPAVDVTVDEVGTVPLLENTAGRGLVYTHLAVPTSNNELYVKPDDRFETPPVPDPGAVVQFNYLGPGGKVPMHRTTTTDYQMFLTGEVILITPAEGYDPESGRGKVQETLVKPGDILIQRGTLHAWENRSNQWARWLGVGLKAEPGIISDEAGTGAQHILQSCFDV